MPHIGESEFVTSNDTEEVLGFISYNLIIENLKQQIAGTSAENKNNLSTLKYNYTDIINQRINFVLKNYKEQEEIINLANETLNDYYITLLNLIEEEYGLYVEFNSIPTLEERNEYINALYRFFVLNYKDNLTTFYKNYIIKDKKGLISAYKDGVNTKDVYFQIIKKELNKNYAILLYELDSIYKNISIRYIEDFIEMIIKEDEDEYDYWLIKEIFIDRNVIEDISCDMDKFMKKIIKNIEYTSSIIIDTKAILYKYFIKLKETKE